MAAAHRHLANEGESELIEQLEFRLAALPARRRGAVAWYPAEVSVIASPHASPDGPLRDAILRQVLLT